MNENLESIKVYLVEIFNGSVSFKFEAGTIIISLPDYQDYVDLDTLIRIKAYVENFYEVKSFKVSYGSQGMILLVRLGRPSIRKRYDRIAKSESFRKINHDTDQIAIL